MVVRVSLTSSDLLFLFRFFDDDVAICLLPGMQGELQHVRTTHSK